MPQIKATGQLTPNDYWQIVMTDEELIKKECRICRKQFQDAELVLICDLCGQMIHKECGYSKLSRCNKGDSGFCSHNQDYYPHYCGRIVTQK